MDIVKGVVVKAVAGRDSGRYFIVVDYEDNFVWISDGKTRKLESPKKKKIKHLHFTDTVAEIDKITNRKLKVYLDSFYCPEIESEV